MQFRFTICKCLPVVVMMAALLLLVSGNYWAYGLPKEKQGAMAVGGKGTNQDQDNDDAPSVPNPTEEKTAGGLQNISEYLHAHMAILHTPVFMATAGHVHTTDALPVHHPEHTTPPPKQG